MTMRAIRMRVRGGLLEPLSDIALPEGAEVTVDIDIQDDDRQAVIKALHNSAGAWSDDSHPELRTREDVVKFVRELRDGFEPAMSGPAYCLDSDVR